MNVPELIEKLTTELGVAAEFLWAVLVRQGYVEGAYSILMIVGAGALSYVAYRLAKKANSVDAMNDVDLQMAYVMGCVLAIATATIVFIVGVGTSRYLFNPEYFALREVIDMLK